MAYLFRFYLLGCCSLNVFKEFSGNPSSFEDFFKGLFLRCSVIKVPVAADLRQQLVQFTTLSSVCQLFFLFSFLLFLFQPTAR